VCFRIRCHKNTSFVACPHELYLESELKGGFFVFKSHTKKIVLTAMLIALEIILTRFLSIQTPIIRISFGFIPIVLIAIMYGPLFAGIGAAIGDILGVSLFSAFAPFPGFTLTAFLAGIVYGLLLHKHPKSLPRICIAAIIVTVALQFVLDTAWLVFFFERGFIALLPTRIIRTLIMLPMQIICIRFIAQERFMKHITAAMR